MLSRLALADEPETARLTQTLTRAEDEIRAERKTSADLGAEIERLRLEQTQLVTREHAVSAEVVSEARSARDEVWSRLRAALIGEAALPDPAAAAGGFEEGVSLRRGERASPLANWAPIRRSQRARHRRSHEGRRPLPGSAQA